jgi:hypothetical protein
MPVAETNLHHFFRPAVRAWLQGESPYGVTWFVNPPWTLFLLLPFAQGPLQLGYGLLFIFSFAAVVATVRSFGGRKPSVLSVLTAPPVTNLLALGQIDAWVLIGLLVGRWAASRGTWIALGLAVALVTTKPQAGGLAAALWLLTLRWKWERKVAALAVFLVVWLVSCLSTGAWWPFEMDLLSYVHSQHMDISTPSLIRGLGLPRFLYPALATSLLLLWTYEARKKGATDRTLALSCLTGALCAPYVARHSASPSLATAFVLVSITHRGWAILCYLLSWIPLLSLLIRPWPGWLEDPLLWVLLIATLRSSPKQDAKGR